MFPCYIHLVSPSLTDVNQMLATIGDCLAVVAHPVTEHWWLKPEVSWVQLPATVGLFTLLYFRLITSKFIYFQHEARWSAFSLDDVRYCRHYHKTLWLLFYWLVVFVQLLLKVAAIQGCSNLMDSVIWSTFYCCYRIMLFVPLNGQPSSSMNARHCLSKRCKGVQH